MGSLTEYVEPRTKFGKPLKFNTPEDLAAKVQGYFDNCTTDKDGKPQCTMTGLALHLNVDTGTLSRYSSRPDYNSIIKKAKRKVIRSVEHMLLHRQAVAGPIFWLKNHAGYVDKRETVQTTEITLDADQVMNKLNALLARQKVKEIGEPDIKVVEQDIKQDIKG